MKISMKKSIWLGIILGLLAGIVIPIIFIAFGCGGQPVVSRAVCPTFSGFLDRIINSSLDPYSRVINSVFHAFPQNAITAIIFWIFLFLPWMILGGFIGWLFGRKSKS